MRGGTVKLIAHRGGRGFGTDNSLEAMERAAASGVRMIEVDVRVTRDNQLVVCHDQNIWGHSVRGNTYEELLKLAPERPLLREVLEKLAGWVAFDIEVKDAPPRAVGEMLEDHRIEMDTLVTSFHRGFLREFTTMFPGVRAGLLYRMPYGRDRKIAAALDLKAEVILPYYHSIDRETVEEAHRQGLAVYAWTVNNTDDVQRLYGWGVDGLITDRYLEVRSFLEERGMV